jgi:hypothetical protein
LSFNSSLTGQLFSGEYATLSLFGRNFLSTALPKASAP